MSQPPPEQRGILFVQCPALTPMRKLQTGAEVRFAEEMGERGPQASTVYVVGKHHIVG